MKGPLLFSAGTIAIVLGIFLPRAQADDPAGPPPPPPAAAAAAEQERSDKSFFANAKQDPAKTQQWSAEVDLNRSGDGHFYANVFTESVRTRYMVDTGATMVALTGRDAEAIGLFWNDSDLQHIADGASGPVLGVPVRIERMELGGFEARNVAAAIVPEGLSISLLGQSFLQTIPNVQIESDRMILSN